MIFIEKILLNINILNKSTNEKTSFKKINGNYDKTNGIITYKELDLDNTNVKIKCQKDIIEIIRDNKEEEMQLNFNLKEQTLGIIHIKELNMDIKICIHTKKLIINKNCIIIEYSLQLSDTDFTQYELIVNFEEV